MANNTHCKQSSADGLTSGRLSPLYPCLWAGQEIESSQPERGQEDLQRRTLFSMSEWDPGRFLGGQLSPQSLQPGLRLGLLKSRTRVWATWPIQVSRRWGTGGPSVPAPSQAFLSTQPVALFCCSVAKSCLSLGDPMDCSTPGFPVYHHLPEFAQNRVH